MLSHVRLDLLDTHRTTDGLREIGWDALEMVLSTPRFSMLQHSTMRFSFLTGKSESLLDSFLEKKTPGLAKRVIYSSSLSTT